MSDIVISGYYGFRNSGDDALLMSIINDLKSINPDAKITVLSNKPLETGAIYKVNAIKRDNVFSVIKEIFNAKMLVSGGGTLIQDGTSTKSLIYYLSVILIAVLLRKKIMLYANGIGPLNNKFNRKLASLILNRVNVITLRDLDAKKELDKINVNKPLIEITADPVFNFVGKEELDDDILLKNNITASNELMLVSVREWKGNSTDFCDVLARFCDYAKDKYNLETVFLPMQPQKDIKITEKIRSKMNSNSYLINSSNDIYQTLAIIKKMKICIGMRLHTLIYASSMCVPQIGIVYDPKITGFLNYIKSEMYADAAKLDIDQMKKMLDDTLSNYDDLTKELLNNGKELKKKASLNKEIASKLLFGGKGK